MTQQRYIDYEEDFLEAMATRFGFSGKTRFVFVTRLREQYAELKDSSFASEHYNYLLEDIKDSHRSDPAIILRDRLKVICDRIESAGCDFALKFQNFQTQKGDRFVKSPPYEGGFRGINPIVSLKKPSHPLWRILQIFVVLRLFPRLRNRVSCPNFK